MRRTGSFIAAIILSFITFFMPSAAFAHDEVVSVSPEAGSTVEAGIIDLNITFNEDVMPTEEAAGFEVVVNDAKGARQAVGCVSPMGTTLSARTAIASAGEYTVTWHSVSNDGHPAEGSYKFNVSGSAELDADLINNCPRLLIAPAPVDDPSAIAYSTDATANDNTVMEIGVLVVVVVLVIGSAIWVTAKRKKPKD